ncbi:hypothetical protein SS209_00652 [Salmonella enterica subsp. enterica serovar Senftenberg str. SS209]|nr:hypothetical protein SS209_00652 [Salmonella enterica subsp. enterica serovar Senftenberg str. SS209]
MFHDQYHQKDPDREREVKPRHQALQTQRALILKARRTFCFDAYLAVDAAFFST